MRNNKYFNVILTICLVVIWSLVVKKVFFNNSGATNVSENQSSFSIQKKTLISEKDTIVLKAIKNPFIRGVATTNAPVSRNTKVVAPTSASKKKVSLSWPVIHYYGYVESNGRIDKRGMIRFDSKLHTMKAGEKYNNITLLKVTPDSIVLAYQKQKRTIKRH